MSRNFFVSRRFEFHISKIRKRIRSQIFTFILVQIHPEIKVRYKSHKLSTMIHVYVYLYSFPASSFFLSFRLVTSLALLIKMNISNLEVYIDIQCLFFDWTSFYNHKEVGWKLSTSYSEIQYIFVPSEVTQTGPVLQTDCEGVVYLNRPGATNWLWGGCGVQFCRLKWGLKLNLPIEVKLDGKTRRWFHTEY